MLPSSVDLATAPEPASRRVCRRGTAMIEFVVATPLLLVVTSLTFFFG